MHPWVFFDEFHEVSMLVLLPIAIWGLWYFNVFHVVCFLFGSLAMNVQILMMCWNVAVKVLRRI